MCWHMAHIYRQQEVSILKWLVTDVLTHVVFMYQLLFLMICFILATFAEDRKATIHDIGILMKHTHTHIYNIYIYIMYIYIYYIYIYICCSQLVPVVRGLSWLLSSFLCILFPLLSFLSLHSLSTVQLLSFAVFLHIHTYIYIMWVCVRARECVRVCVKQINITL